MQSLLATHLHQLEQLYSFRNAPMVAEILLSHPNLPALLIEAHEQIQSYFPQAPCYLQVVSDPENFLDQEVVLSIGTTLDVDEAFALLEQLDRDWWLARTSRRYGKVTTGSLAGTGSELQGGRGRAHLLRSPQKPTLVRPDRKAVVDA